MNRKICALITDRLIEEMEKGVIPWDKILWLSVSGFSWGAHRFFNASA